MDANTTTQAGFEAFMIAQIAAIEESGMDPDQWIEVHAAEFRATWEASHQVN